MPAPDLRCLECNRQFADLTADQEVERCAECGKFVVATPTMLTVVPITSPAPGSDDSEANADVPTVGKAKGDDELPLAQLAKAVAPPPMTNMPAWARRPDDAPQAKPVDTVRPAFPPRASAVPKPAPEARSYTELPSQTAEKKQKIGVALVVAFLFLLGMVAAIGVLAYTIIRGLQMKKVLTEGPAIVQPLEPVGKA